MTNHSEYSLAYYHRNKDRLNALRRKRNARWMAEWRRKNPEVAIQRKREWAAKHPDAFKKWYQANRDKAIASVLSWQSRHPHKIVEYRRRSAGRISRVNKQYVSTLADCYVRAKLSRGSRVPARMWPASLVELKRAELKVKRLCKTLETSKN